MRFVCAVELCKSWRKYGGLACRLSRLSTALGLAIAENVVADSAYRRLSGANLQGKERHRPDKHADFTDLCRAEDFTAQ